MQQGIHQAYSRAQTLGDNPQETIGRSLLEVARRMTDLIAGPADDDAFDAALVLNLRIWSALAQEMLDEQNPAPVEVKSNILSLHRFVENHTFETLSDREPAKLDILVTINRNLVGGIMPT